MRDGELAHDYAVVGGEKYELMLRVRAMPLPSKVTPRFVYAFVIDSSGKSTLLYPLADSGSVENRFPPSPPATEISLGEMSAFEVAPPYGVDTLFLLTSDQAIPDPSILEWSSVRAPSSRPRSALERLLALTESGTRSFPFLTPSSWSIDKVTYESLAPHATTARK